MSFRTFATQSTKDGRILNLALSRDPKNPVVSLRPSLTRAHREGSVVTVPLGIGSGRPLTVSVPGTKGPLDSKTYAWATAVELGRLLRETTPGAWRSPETDECSTPAYATDGGPDGRTAWLRREPHLWLTRPNVPFGSADGKFGVTTNGPRFGLFDASGKNGGWTGVQEKAAASGVPYAGATTIAGGRIALVRVLD